jgi:adenylate kinase
VCDACGAALVQRKDDEEQVVRDRLEVYHRNTAPLVRYYEGAGLLRRIEGARPIDAVTAAVREAAEGAAA